MPSFTSSSNDSDESSICEIKSTQPSKQSEPLPKDKKQDVDETLKERNLSSVTTLATPEALVTQKPLVTPSTISSSTETPNRQLDFLSPAQTPITTTEKYNDQTSTEKHTSVITGRSTYQNKPGKRKRRKEMPNLSKYFANDSHLQISHHVPLNIKSLPEVLQPTLTSKETTEYTQCESEEKNKPSEEEVLQTDHKVKKRKI